MFKMLPKENKVQLCVDYHFRYDNKVIWIPRGYIFDGASIPKVFWSLVGSAFDPDYLEPALKHDWCFLTECLSFKKANQLFYQDLKKNGVSLFHEVGYLESGI